MEVIVAIVSAIAVGGVLYALNRLSSATARELAIPFDGAESPRQQVKDALERMGCVISQDQPDLAVGLLRGSAGSWGQELTVTMKSGHLLVRSTFSNVQVFGRSRNQENVERFRKEWERRGEYERSSTNPAVLAKVEAQATRNAANAAWVGAFMTVAALAILGVVVFVPAREGASPGSKVRLAGLALLLLAYGLTKLAAGAKRLRNKASLGAASGRAADRKSFRDRSH